MFFTIFHPVLLGGVFLNLKDELEEVYKLYCQNHDDAISLLETYEKDENVQRHVLESLERLRYVLVSPRHLKCLVYYISDFTCDIQVRKFLHFLSIKRNSVRGFICSHCAVQLNFVLQFFQ